MDSPVNKKLKTSDSLLFTSIAQPQAPAAAAVSFANNTASIPATAASAGGGANNEADLVEERLIDAEYKIWKKNTPYLYDLVMTHSLEWPSLTCQWLPSVKTHESTKEHSLILGTHTTGEPNYLMVASVILPKPDSNAIVPASMNSSEVAKGSSSSTATKTEDDQQGTTDAADAEEVTAVTPVSNYDEDKKEIGGYGFNGFNSGTTTTSGKVTTGSSYNTPGKIEIRMKINHLGEVNRARYMPQNHFVVASRGADAEIYVFDLTKHSSFPKNQDFCPQVTCVGHEKEGYGMAWSDFTQGLLASASDDKTVRLWDVQHALSNSNKSSASTTSGTQIGPKTTFYGHASVVEDVAWHGRDRNLIGSVGDDSMIMLWDVRKPGGKPTDNAANGGSQAIQCIKNAHDGDINSIAFNPVNEYLFATGSADKTVALWDMRNMKTKQQTLRGHNDQVFNVSWNPLNEAILASCSADRRVIMWDLSRIGEEQTPEDAEDGPPELLFIHGGHTSRVSDFSWNLNEEWCIASVAEDNVCQIWNIAEEIYAADGDTDDEDDGDEEKKMDTSGGQNAMLTEDDLE